MADSAIQVNGTSPSVITPSVTPIQLAFPLPTSPHTTVHMHLTILATSILLFLTTTTAYTTTSIATLGSFVYAIPNRLSPSQTPLSTPLYVRESSLEFANRLAKILARRTGKPTYVGNSISFAGAGLGGTVEEEMEGLTKVVNVVMAEVDKAR